MNSPEKYIFCREIRRSGADPLNVFQVVRKFHREAFFFESSASIGLPPEYSVIGLGPFETLRDRNGFAEISIHGKVSRTDEPFFSALSRLVQSVQQTAPMLTPYHHGGVFGVVGYDSVVELEPKLKDRGCFLKSKEQVRSEVLLARTLIIFDHRSKSVHLVDAQSSDASETALDEMERFVRVGALRSFQVQVSESQQKSSLSKNLPEMDASRLRPSLGLEGFRKGVETIQKHIKRGDIFQAVLAERFETEVKAQDIEIFAKLRKRSPAPYHFFFSNAERSFFGASPEALVRLQNGDLRSNPIAGTRPRGKSEAEDRLLARSLLRSRKEAAEHLMLVDLARNDIGRVAQPGTVKVSNFRSLKRFSNVMHLVSEVDGRLADDASVVDALLACFPAGTLSGAPKVRAMEILADLEGVPRGLYGGAVVAFNGRGGLDSCIAIRSAEMKGQTIILRAGAGIVADSKFENEYDEVKHKLRALREAIALAEQKVASRPVWVGFRRMSKVLQGAAS
jgi:anthranilate synthase component 1